MRKPTPAFFETRAAKRRGAALALCAVLLAGFLAVSASAQPAAMLKADLAAALDAAPAGAEVVVVIPSMQNASDAVAELAAMFDADDPEMADPLGAFKRDMGFAAGLDDDGAAIIVFTGLANAITNNEEPTPIMLMPVSDYALFVGQFGGDADGVTEVAFKHEAGFAKEMAGYAVMAEDAADVEAYAAGEQGRELLERVGSYAQDASEDALFAVYVDVAALAPALREKIDEAVQEVGEDMQGQEMPLDLNMAGLVAAYGELGKTLLDGVDAGVFTAAYDEQGLTFDTAVQLVEGSTLAGYLTGNAGKFDHLLGEMPDQPYLFATAFDVQAVDFAKITTDLLGAVNEAAGDSPMVAGWVNTAKQQMGIYEQMNAGASTFYAPDMAAMMTGGFMKTLAVYDVKDADQAIQLWKQGIESMPDMFANLGDDAPGMDVNVDYTENALELDGHAVHQYQVNIILPPEMMQQMGPAAMMMGNSGYGGYITTVGDRLLVTTVPDPQLIKQGIAAATNADGLGTTAVITEAREHLPKQPVLEAFISLDGIATAANPFLMMMGGGVQLDVPADLQPVSVGLGIDGHAVGERVFVPNQVMLFVKDAIDKAQAMQQQQRGGGGGQRAPF